MPHDAPRDVPNASASGQSRPQPLSTDRLTLTVEEAANILGISRAFAYQLVAKKELPAVRLGRRIVVPRKAVEAMVEQSAEAVTGDDARHAVN
ncbi:MAG TPA: helix-turn-helix domain-containing protein [Acidimicrobiales bacterium]|nr:helix-turn-helix domain-containing protein [Acidimicrobiales bacterium]